MIGNDDIPIWGGFGVSPIRDGAHYPSACRTTKYRPQKMHTNALETAIMMKFCINS